MITEAILNLFFGIADKALATLPDIYWTVDTTAWDYVYDILSMVAYLLPLDTVKQIISLILAVTFFRIAIAVARTVMGFIPFV